MKPVQVHFLPELCYPLITCFDFIYKLVPESACFGFEKLLELIKRGSLCLRECFVELFLVELCIDLFLEGSHVDFFFD